jgi:hypothetical protein
MAQIRYLTDDKGRDHLVADALEPGDGKAWKEAPEPYASQLAKFWYTTPFTPEPWHAFSVDPVNYDEKMSDFEQVQGVMPQRGAFIKGGGNVADFVASSQRYWKDFELFGGIIPQEDVDPPLLAQLQQANPEFAKWGLGEGGLNRFLGGGSTPQVNIFFPQAPLTPKQSGSLGRFFHRHEAVDRTFPAFTIICRYQELLIRAGTHVANPHPTLPIPLQQMNAKLV